MIFRVALLSLTVVQLFSNTANATTGITETVVKVGSTGSLTGDISEIGSGMAAGAEAYYDRLNASGGVNGRKIVFTPKDDSYDPAKAAANVKSLVATEQIFALVGGNGTPIAQAIMPTVEEKNLLFLFTMTGGSIVFPMPPKKNIFQVRISYADEAANLVEYIIKATGSTDIGLFRQDDAFGTAGRSGVERVLAAHGSKLHGDGAYQRNTVEVETAVDELIKAHPKVVFMQAVAKPAVAFMKRCIEKGYNPIFMGPSPLGSFTMKERLVGVPVELYISEIVPWPLDTKMPLVANYQKDMQAIHKKTYDFFSLEGYIGAMLFAEAIRRAGDAPTTESVSHALEAMKEFDLGGLKVGFSPEKHWAMNSSFIFRLKSGELSPAH